jgi:hypothetical protein
VGDKVGAYSEDANLTIRIADLRASRYNFARWGDASRFDARRQDSNAARRANSLPASSLGSINDRRLSMGKTISDDSVVVVAKDQVSCDLAGEAAILNIKSGVYYGLDPVGARIWNLMQEPRAVADIQSAITDEYDVEPGRAAQDLVGLLEKLLAEGLIEVKDGSGS